jgi:hypothetical protein
MFSQTVRKKKTYGNVLPQRAGKKRTYGNVLPQRAGKEKTYGDICKNRLRRKTHNVFVYKNCLERKIYNIYVLPHGALALDVHHGGGDGASVISACLLPEIQEQMQIMRHTRCKKAIIIRLIPFYYCTFAG